MVGFFKGEISERIKQRPRATAIASLEDLKAAQKEGLSIYVMGYGMGSVKRLNRMRFDCIDIPHSEIRDPNLLGAMLYALCTLLF